MKGIGERNNMEEWKITKISDICTRVTSGGTPKSTIAEYYGGNIPWLNTKEVNFNRIYKTEKFITVMGLENSSAKLIATNSIVVAMYGATAGKSAIIKIPLTTNQACCNLTIDPTKADYRFVYYALYNDYDRLASFANGGAQQNLNAQQIKDFHIPYPSLEKQKRIVNILSSLDDKIELNNRINANLEQQAQALFHRWFVEFEFPNEQGLPYKSNGGAFIDSELGRIPNGWKVFHADEVFHINIGKTPPRKEQEWFSNESKNNIKWVSISDLGGIGVFVNDSKEYLSKDAISKFNIIVVPRNTVLLSFKLTVGRVAIANCKLTTNEAIARFYLPKEYFREYTYLALKNYNYSKLGSTSSIAIAVNSKIIKAMPILIPSDNILKLFNVVMAPVFNIIEKNQTTIENLVSLRDTLLPKLMNNEINL